MPLYDAVQSLFHDLPKPLTKNYFLQQCSSLITRISSKILDFYSAKRNMAPDVAPQQTSPEASDMAQQQTSSKASDMAQQQPRPDASDVAQQQSSSEGSDVAQQQSSSEASDVAQQQTSPKASDVAQQQSSPDASDVAQQQSSSEASDVAQQQTSPKASRIDRLREAFGLPGQQETSEFGVPVITRSCKYLRDSKILNTNPDQQQWTSTHEAIRKLLLFKTVIQCSESFENSAGCKFMSSWIYRTSYKRSRRNWRSTTPLRSTVAKELDSAPDDLTTSEKVQERS